MSELAVCVQSALIITISLKIHLNYYPVFRDVKCLRLLLGFLGKPGRHLSISHMDVHSSCSGRNLELCSAGFSSSLHCLDSHCCQESTAIGLE